MYRLLLAAMVLGAVADFKVDMNHIHRADIYKMLKIEWKPISVFPKEAARFN